MKPEMKKLIIANLPYLLFVYLFGKLGQAYRLAEGIDLSQKLLHFADGCAAAFESAAPSFHPIDLLIGVAGAAALRLMVYCKGKNAKKYRKGVEYGSARWGGPKDIAPYAMLGKEVDCLCGLLQILELRPTCIARALLGLDVVLQVDPQGDTLALPVRASVHGQPLDPAGDGFLGIVLTQRLAAGEAFLSGGAERNKFTLLDLIALRRHEPEKIVKVFGLRDYCVNGSFQFGFPALTLAPGIPFRIALAFIPAGLYHRQTVFPAQPVTGAPDIGVALPIRIVLAVVYHIHSTENQVIVDVALVDVGCQHIGVFALQHFLGKLLADLMGLYRRGLAGGKGLYQVVGQIVAFLDRLRQQHFKFYVRCFIGAAKGGHQHFVLGLVRVLDVVQRLFQR